MNIVYVLNRPAFHYVLNEAKFSSPTPTPQDTVLTVYSLPSALISDRNFAFCSHGVSAYYAFQNERVISLKVFSHCNGDTVCFL
jgi:hypothetical protein